MHRLQSSQQLIDSALIFNPSKYHQQGIDRRCSGLVGDRCKDGIWYHTVNPFPIFASGFPQGVSEVAFLKAEMGWRRAFRGGHLEQHSSCVCNGWLWVLMPKTLGRVGQWAAGQANPPPQHSCDGSISMWQGRRRMWRVFLMTAFFVTLPCIITFSCYSVFPLDTEFLFQGLQHWMKSRTQTSSRRAWRFPMYRTESISYLWLPSPC